MNKLTIEFYNRKNVLQIAQDLLGKLITTNINGYEARGRIVETEAYVAITDKASHAYNGKRTARNEHMYAQPGTTYVYICYGIHRMFNVVTNACEIPDAVLIRGVEPLTGLDIMLDRTGKDKPGYTLTRGPGNIGKAFGIEKIHSGISLHGDVIYLSDDGFMVDKKQVGSSARIGVDYAGADALLPYRYYLKGNKYVSGKPIL